MNWRWPRTLFGRTALTLGVALVLLQALAVGIIAWQIMYPLGLRATDDLAELMVLSAQTWVELPPTTRRDFEQELITNHGLLIAEAHGSLPATTSSLPYRFLLESALARRMGRPVPIRTTVDPEWFWGDIPMGDKQIRIGFARERIGMEPPTAITLLLLTITLLTLGTALILARRLSRPLARLAQAAAQVGQGEIPEPLSEQGPVELAQLARRFNRMARDVHELLVNRTTLLAGISHDLRTPLTRMQLAIEMLPRPTDPTLLDGLRHDIADIDRLIGQYLELGQGLQQEQREQMDVYALLEQCVADARRGGAVIQLAVSTACIRSVNRLALVRCVANLIENAVRYGAGLPVDVTMACEPQAVVIRVLDRGPGIPPDVREAVFRPFYRLEPSRSAVTGGSGLGLAITRQLAHANGWQVELFDREGGGTEARLTIAVSTNT